VAKRFTDSNKYKKPFIRGLPGAYKLLWDYLYHDCDHAGIWIVDFEIAQLYIGSDMPVSEKKALEIFNKTEVRIVEFDGGKKWFLPGFIDFQYGELKENNRLHLSVIHILEKNNLYKNKPLTSPLEGAKDKYKDKDKEQYKDKDIVLETEIEKKDEPAQFSILGQLKKKWVEVFPKSFVDKTDIEPLRLVAEKIISWDNLSGKITDSINGKIILQRWGEIISHCKDDPHLSKYSIAQINKHFSSVTQSIQSKKNGKTNHQPASGNRKASGAEKFLQRAKEKFNTPGNEGG
jgi:hypothetical protein